MPVFLRYTVMALCLFTLGACTDPAPIETLALQPILSPDITKHRLHGTGCAFVAQGGGIGAVLLAQDKRGVIKIANAVIILAPDTASVPLPMGSWSRYTGEEYALSLTASGAITPLGTGQQFKGQLVITDELERLVYKASGDVQCRTI
jgi:hypothetical protein